MTRTQKKTGVISAVTVCAALAIFTPFKNEHEGFKLKAYQDVAGVWTACHGIAYVKPNSVYTPSQCEQMDQSADGAFMSGVVARIRVPMSPETLAAHASFAYNIGLGGYTQSKTLRLTNAGDIKGGCHAMMSWTIANGHDCKEDKGMKHGCYGLFLRRQSEMNLCLLGAVQ